MISLESPNREINKITLSFPSPRARGTMYQYVFVKVFGGSVGILNGPLIESITYLLNFPPFYWIFNIPMDKSPELKIRKGRVHIL